MTGGLYMIGSSHERKIKILIRFTYWLCQIRQSPLNNPGYMMGLANGTVPNKPAGEWC